MEYPTVEHVQKTTAFKTPRRALGAIETLKWLESGEPHQFDGLKGRFKFDMRTFVGRTTADNQCGTVCCIAGAIHAFTQKIDGDGNTALSVFALNHLFDIGNNPPLYDLFFAPNSYTIAPAQAAITLRKYLEEGVVDWSHRKRGCARRYLNS